MKRREILGLLGAAAVAPAVSETVEVADAAFVSPFDPMKFDPPLVIPVGVLRHCSNMAAEHYNSAFERAYAKAKLEAA